MNIRCNQHRLLPWIGHGICLSCERVWKRILAAPDVCTCGARLLPFGKLQVEGLIRAVGRSYVRTGFSGRPYCAKCAEGALKDETESSV